MGQGLFTEITPIDIYEGCILGKAHHQRFPHSKTSSTYPLQVIHSDLCGPMETKSLTGNKYFLTFIVMTTLSTPMSTFSVTRVKCYNTSRYIKAWWKINWIEPSRSFGLITAVNTFHKTLLSNVRLMV